MKLAAIGSNCVDYYVNLKKGFPGGGPVNMAVYTVRLGGKASYIGPAGSDEFGTMMRKSIAEKGVDISHFHVLEGKTAVSQVELINGERIFGDYDEGVLEKYTLSGEDIVFICGHDMVVCDLWGKVEGDFPRLRSSGIKTVFDCHVRPYDNASQRAMPHTDYLFFSSDDPDMPVIREQMREFHAKGPRLVIAMLGELGSVCFDGDAYYFCGIVPCKVVDSMGAGDSYIAGFLFALQQGKSIEECMRSGAANASVTLGYEGAW
jgi:fructoselysine 6-kinase